MVVPPNGWFTMENPINIDDLGVPLFQETFISRFTDVDGTHAHMLRFNMPQGPKFGVNVGQFQGETFHTWSIWMHLGWFPVFRLGKAPGEDFVDEVWNNCSAGVKYS